MAEKILNVFRILLKIFVSFVTFCIFLVAIVYWIERLPFASLPLLTASALSYYCALKDHSEDYWKKKYDSEDEPLLKTLCMITVYLITLLVILFGIVISAHLK